MPANAQPPLQASTIPEIRVDGDARPELARDLAWLEIDEDIHGLKRLQAAFVAVGPRAGASDEPLLWLDGQVLDFGRALSVHLGPSDAREEMFAGRISALELGCEAGRAPEVTCLAEDRLMDLRMTRRMKTYENVSDADLLQAIASEHGLSPAADVQGPTWPLVQQWNQSDLAFLRERAWRLAAELWVEGTTLHMASRDRRGGGRLTLIQGSTLLQVRLRADLAHQRSSVHVSGWDDGGESIIDEQADASVAASEAQGGNHGPQVLARAFGTRDSFRVRDVPLRGEHAQAMARAAMLRRARRFVGASGVTSGHTALRVGTLLRLERVGAPFEGDGYYVTRARHRFDLHDGYRTTFEAERAWTSSP
jgi:phage protein D